MKKYGKRLALLLIILYVIQAMVGIYFGVKIGIQTASEINKIEK